MARLKLLPPTRTTLCSTCHRDEATMGLPDGSRHCLACGESWWQGLLRVARVQREHGPDVADALSYSLQVEADRRRPLGETPVVGQIACQALETAPVASTFGDSRGKAATFASERPDSRIGSWFAPNVDRPAQRPPATLPGHLPQAANRAEPEPTAPTALTPRLVRRGGPR